NNKNHKNQRCSRPLYSSQATDDPTPGHPQQETKQAGRTQQPTTPNRRLVAREPNSAPPTTTHSNSRTTRGRGNFAATNVPPMSNHPQDTRPGRWHHPHTPEHTTSN